MATKRLRGSTWTYVVKRSGLLDRPVYLSFPSEEEGDAYVARLERLLDDGIVPPELVEQQYAGLTISEAVREYLHAAPVSVTDRSNLGVVMERIGTVKISALTYTWVESWVATMKRGNLNLSPSAIRHYVGAVARMWDWCRRSNMVAGENPLRLLPRGYAKYGEHDQDALGKDAEMREDISRDVRLAPEWEPRIRDVLAGGFRRVMPSGKASERVMSLAFRESLLMLFDLALETAMRMREMVTLDIEQVDLDRRTVFLLKTKNGDKRQVPLSSVALDRMRAYLACLEQEGGIDGFAAKNGKLFPWWDGRPGLVNINRVIARVSRQYARIFDAAECPEFTFHDTRHEATCRLYERTKLSDLQIAKITGHKDLRMLMRYANLRGSDLAESLW